MLFRDGGGQGDAGAEQMVERMMAMDATEDGLLDKAELEAGTARLRTGRCSVVRLSCVMNPRDWVSQPAASSAGIRPSHSSWRACSWIS